MWSVSDQWLQALAAPHKLTYTCTVTTPDGTASDLTLSSGTVTVNSGQGIRRTAALGIKGGTVEYELLSTPGSVIRLTHGLVYSSTEQELVPLITGELSSAALQVGDGMISVNVADFWQRVVRNQFLTAYTPAPTSGRVAEITNAVTAAVPSATVTNTSSDGGTVAVTQTWTQSRSDMINAFATDGGTEAFFTPDGNFLIRDVPKISDSTVWLLKTGDGGTIKSIQRSRPLDQLYNTVIVTPSSNDGTQAWTQVTAQLTDPSSPRAVAKIGVSPYGYSPPTTVTQSEAQTIAARILQRVQGTSETLALEAISNPALEGNDIIRASAPTDAGQQVVTHFLDSVTFDVVSGAMTANTRSYQELTT